MMIRALLIALIVAVPAIAQEQSIVGISVPLSGGSTACGTGCIVAVSSEACPDPAFADWRKAKVLTAAHVVEGTETAVIRLASGSITNGRVKRRAPNGDIAVLDAFVPPGSVATPIGEVIAPGTMVVGYGLGGLGTKWPQEGEVRKLPAVFQGVEKSTVIAGGSVVKRETMLFDVAPRQGDSGGPIICDGKVVGVISGGIVEFRESRTWPLLSAHTSVIRETVR